MYDCCFLDCHTPRFLFQASVLMDVCFSSVPLCYGLIYNVILLLHCYMESQSVSFGGAYDGQSVDGVIWGGLEPLRLSGLMKGD